MKQTKNRIIKNIIVLSKRWNFPRRRSSCSVPSTFLVITTTGIGDTLWGTPAIEALRGAYPASYIGVLTNSTGYDLLKGNPNIDALFIFKKGLAGLFSLPKLFKKLRRRRFDTAFMFHVSDRIIWPLCFFAGVPEIIGIEGRNKGLDFILSRTINPRTDIHGIEERIELVKRTGARAVKGGVSFYLSGSERDRMRTLLRDRGISEDSLLIGLHPGAHNPFKCWPAENFVELGNRLKGSFGCRIIITGDGGEKRMADEIASGIADAISLAGIITLRETAALIERMALFITNDTGPMHIAFALKTPTVALFSPTDPRLCGPWHAEKVEVIEKPKVCSPCTGKKCYNPVCMEQITVEEVFARAEVLLRNSPRDDFHRDPCSLPLHNENS